MYRTNRDKQKVKATRTHVEGKNIITQIRERERKSLHFLSHSFPFCFAPHNTTPPLTPTSSTFLATTFNLCFFLSFCFTLLCFIQLLDKQRERKREKVCHVTTQLLHPIQRQSFQFSFTTLIHTYIQIPLRLDSAAFGWILFLFLPGASFVKIWSQRERERGREREMGNSFGCSASGERLVSAARDGDLVEAKMLLECNPGLAKYSTFGGLNSPLHFAASKGHNEVSI